MERCPDINLLPVRSGTPPVCGKVSLPPIRPSLSTKRLLPACTRTSSRPGFIRRALASKCNIETTCVPEIRVKDVTPLVDDEVRQSLPVGSVFPGADGANRLRLNNRAKPVEAVVAISRKQVDPASPRADRVLRMCETNSCPARAKWPDRNLRSPVEGQTWRGLQW